MGIGCDGREWDGNSELKLTAGHWTISDHFSK